MQETENTAPLLAVDSPEVLHGTQRRSPIFLGQRTAPFFQRAMAKSIDVVIALALLFIGRRIHPAVGPLCSVLYLSLKDGFGLGQSVGKRVVGIRVIEDALGMAASSRESSLRNLPFSLGVLFTVAPILWPLFIFVSIPWLLLELGLTFFMPTGVRLGDIVANTLVDELKEELGSSEFPT